MWHARMRLGFTSRAFFISIEITLCKLCTLHAAKRARRKNGTKAKPSVVSYQIGKGKGEKVDETRLIVVCHFLHRPPVLIARLYLTHQDKYLHQGGCPALARWRECRRALLGHPGLPARRVGRRKGYRFHLQGLIGGMEGLWVLVRVIRSLYVLV